MKYKIEESTNISTGAYSLFDGWVNKPDLSSIPEPINIDAKVDEYKSKAEECNTIEDIDNFIDNLYRIRQSSLLDGGEFSENNLLFKELRALGVIDQLKARKVELENQEMSLE